MLSPPNFRNSKAYLIGISGYTHPIRELKTPTVDIKSIENVLIDFDDVQLYPDPDVKQFTDILERVVSEVNDDANPADRVFIYFAGHGKALQNENKPEGYLLLKNNGDEPYENYSYKIEDLIDVINTLKCRHMLLVLDCCFSGAVQWSINMRMVGNEESLKITNPLYNLYTTNPAWQIITSASYNQESIDSFRMDTRAAVGDTTNSPFAHVLLNALRGVKREEYFPNNIISSRKLHDYITTELTQYLDTNNIIYKQSPGIFTLLNDKQGQFVFSINEDGHAADFDWAVLELSNPYKGLEYYGAGDKDVFFGRDDLIKQFLKDAAANHDFLVTGPSGIGKSSLVRAGFIPRLQSRFNIPDENVFTARMATYKTDINIEQLSQPGIEKFVVFIDQFEEVLAVTDTETLENINKIIMMGIEKENIYLILSAREDKAYRIFDEGRLQLKETELTKIYVPHPSAAELEDMIIKPALRHATIIRSLRNENAAPEDITINADKSFLQRIVNTYLSPGSLPFLSTAMYHWFEESVIAEQKKMAGARVLKASVWEKFNQTDKVFENIMQQVEKDSRENFQRFMFRAIAYNTANAGKPTNLPVRRQFTKDEIGLNDELLFSKLEDKRIIRKFRVPGIADDYYELAHDSIIEKWLVNKNWFKERKNKEEIVNTHNELIVVALTWEKRSRSNKILWNNNPGLKILQPEFKPAVKNSPVKRFFLNVFTLWTKLPGPFKNYYTETEECFIAKSIRRKTFRAKFVARLFTLLLSGVLVFTNYYVQSIMLQKKKDDAALLADTSVKYGKPERLYLLREAYKLSPDESIKKQLINLLNSSSMIGNPFCFASLKPGIDYKELAWDPVNKKITFKDEKENKVTADLTKINDIKISRFTGSQAENKIKKIVEQQSALGFSLRDRRYEKTNTFLLFSNQLETKYISMRDTTVVISKIFPNYAKCSFLEKAGSQFYISTTSYPTDTLKILDTDGKIKYTGVFTKPGISVASHQIDGCIVSPTGNGILYVDRNDVLEYRPLVPGKKMADIPISNVSIYGLVNVFFETDSTIMLGAVETNVDNPIPDFDINVCRISLNKAKNKLIRQDTLFNKTVQSENQKQLFDLKSCGNGISYLINNQNHELLIFGLPKPKVKLGVSAGFKGFRVIKGASTPLFALETSDKDMITHSIYQYQDSLELKVILTNNNSGRLEEYYSLNSDTFLITKFENGITRIYDFFKQIQITDFSDRQKSVKSYYEISKDTLIVYDPSGYEFRLYNGVIDGNLPLNISQTGNGYAVATYNTEGQGEDGARFFKISGAELDEIDNFWSPGYLDYFSRIYTINLEKINDGIFKVYNGNKNKIGSIEDLYTVNSNSFVSSPPYLVVKKSPCCVTFYNASDSFELMDAHDRVKDINQVGILRNELVLVHFTDSARKKKLKVFSIDGSGKPDFLNNVSVLFNQFVCTSKKAYYLADDKLSSFDPTSMKSTVECELSNNVQSYYVSELNHQVYYNSEEGLRSEFLYSDIIEAANNIPLPDFTILKNNILQNNKGIQVLWPH